MSNDGHDDNNSNNDDNKSNNDNNNNNDMGMFIIISTMINEFL